MRDLKPGDRVTLAVRVDQESSNRALVVVRYRDMVFFADPKDVTPSAPEPVIAGARVVLPGGTGTVRTVWPPIPARVTVDIGRGVMHTVPMSDVRPAPKPERKVAPRWARVSCTWQRGDLAWINDGGVNGGSARKLIDLGAWPAPIVVVRARIDAHLIARGYTLEGGPVEGVYLRIQFRPDMTVAELRAFEVPDDAPAMIRHMYATSIDTTTTWAPVAAWLIQHPEAPIDWSIEVAP